MHRIPALATALLLACAATPALAAKAQTTYTKAEFFQALNAAYGENWKRDGGHESTRYGMSGKTSMEEVPNAPATGGWRFTLNAACPFPDSNNSASYNYNKVMSFELPAAVFNYGNNFQFAFQTQAVSDLYAPYVEKGLADHRKDLQKEFKDMPGTLERPAGLPGYLVQATYDFGSGVKPEDISKRLVFLMSKSKFVLCDIVTYSWLANEKLWDELKGDIKAPLTREQFLVLYPLFRNQGYADSSTTVAGGAWAQKGDGWRELFENYTDRLEASMGMSIPKGIPAAQAEAIKAELQQLPPAKGAQKTVLYWTDGYLWLASVYPYAGMSGRDVPKAIDTFSKNHAEKYYKAAQKALKKHL